MRKRRVVGRIYGMNYSWKGHKHRNRHKNRIKRSGEVRLVYVYDINHNIPTTWRWARGDARKPSKEKVHFTAKYRGCYFITVRCVRESAETERFLPQRPNNPTKTFATRGSCALRYRAKTTITSENIYLEQWVRFWKYCGVSWRRKFTSFACVKKERITLVCYVFELNCVETFPSCLSTRAHLHVVWMLRFLSLT